MAFFNSKPVWNWETETTLIPKAGCIIHGLARSRKHGTCDIFVINPRATEIEMEIGQRMLQEWLDNQLIGPTPAPPLVHT